ncbi:hypothetical protein SAY87_022908 [Trapa incisa]|uniref:IST1-like protein n=1 Tax=Trapa incisa TaxID=236973 RepID=A0AAN7K537_9MYRT|nr:hypothetical protein SAY87_022908 [Trapa incisa]
MLDGILGRGFASKCKSLIKLVKSRIDVIKKRREATQRFLKEDMANLLANGLDVNAYGMAEKLLVELTLSRCYDFVEKCCDFLLEHLSIMQKQSECPKDCMEAVASLMFAAARFANLPELRDLRQIFQERYGNSVDLCLSKEFMDNLAPDPFAMEKKVHLMQDIASNFSINWNAKNFEQRMSKASYYEQEKSVLQKHPKDNGFHHATDDKIQLPNSGAENLVGGENLKFHAVEASINRQRFRKHHEVDSLKRNEYELSDCHHSADNQLRKDHSYSPRGEKQDAVSVRKERKSPNPIATRPDAFSQRKGYEYPEKMDVPLHQGPGYGDHFLPTSPKGGVKGTLTIRNNSGCDSNGHNSLGREKSEGDKSHRDNFAPTPVRSKVKVSSFAPNSCGNNHDANALTRVKSEGDRDEDTFAATSSKCEIKVTSSVGSNDVNEHSYNPVRRVKSNGDRTYYKCTLPPPYVKPNVKAKDVSYIANSEITPAIADFNSIPKSPAVCESTSAAQRLEDVQKQMLYPDKAAEHVGSARKNSHVSEKDYYKHVDEADGIHLEKPRSSRRRHIKSRSAHNDFHGHDEDAGGGRRSSRSRRDDHRQGLQILFDDEQSHKYEEERVIDRLLIHYSKKPSTSEGGKVKRKSRSRHHDDARLDLGESTLSRQAEIQRPEGEFGIIPTRSVSLPREQPSAPPLPTKVFTRAATFQLDRSDAAKHVHPKLPDYDDLAARFSALRGGK